MEISDSSEDNLASIFKEIDDSQKKHLHSLFLTKGRGRRPNPPELHMKATHRLLLQLFALKIESGASWETLHSWSVVLFPYFPGNKIRHVIERVVGKATKSDVNSRENFYNVTIDLDIIGPYCSELGITRTVLNEPLNHNVTISAEQLTNGALLELKEATSNLFATMNLLCPETFTQSDLRKVVSSVQKRQRAAKKKKKGVLMKHFLQEKVVCFSNVKRNVLVSEEQQSDINQEVKLSVSQNSKQPSELKELKITKKTLQDANEKNDYLKMKMNALEELYSEGKQKVTELEQELLGAQKNLNVSVTEANLLQSKVTVLNGKLLERKSVPSMKKALKRKTVRLSEKEREINYLSSEITLVKKRKEQLKRELISMKKKLYSERKRSTNLCEQVTNLKQELLKCKGELCNVQAELLESRCDMMQLKTDGPGHAFCEGVEKCVMELVCELDVPTTKAGKVIECVSRWIHNKSIAKDELPSTSTANNIADRAHVLAKMQVAEELETCDRWTLHNDGTSRDGKKIVGTQAVTDKSQVLSLGFTNVAVEDSSTLLDNCISLLEELSEIHHDSDTEKETFDMMLEKMVATMSDRSSVNKAFNEQLAAFKSNLVGENVSTHFLYCNAHFLLGLSNICTTVLREAEKALSIEKPLGRDSSSKFSSFKSNGEAATSRFIRTACDVLGPRGDEKNGCRANWESFCCTSGKKSFISSFRLNRFNNFFEGAAGLYHHREQIDEFLSKLQGKLNLKLESVLLDAQCERLQAFVRALGIIFVKITGPFWNMLQTGNVQYVDQYIYIQKMYNKFLEWSHDASSLLSDQEGIFPEFAVKMSPVIESLFVSTQHDKLTKQALEKICSGFLTVTERQLRDFLPGGQFGEAPSEDLRNKLQFCHLTNLVSEYEFGSLDFSIFRRRHASTFYHSGVQMVKCNKTISSWLASKTETEQSQLLTSARGKAEKHREKHREKEKGVQHKIRMRLEENLKRKNAKELDMIQKKTSLITEVQKHGGPCKRSSDIQNILNSCKSQRQQMTVLKNEIRYLQVVMNIKDKRLAFLKKNTSELEEDLKQVLTDVYRDQDVQTKSSGVKRKTEEPQRSAKKRCMEEFNFSSQGIWIAVAYEEDFYIGSVINVIDKHHATVQFLQRALQGTFRWPRIDDVADIESKYVISSDFTVDCLTGGRKWRVPDIDYLDELYKEYVAKYF